MQGALEKDGSLKAELTHEPEGEAPDADQDLVCDEDIKGASRDL